MLSVTLAGPSFATTWHVPSERTTIQDALNAATPGDSILVAPGVYEGPLNRNLDFGGKDLVLTSLAGPEQTILDCADVGRGFRFANGETRNAVVDGFTILRGRALPVPGIADAAGGGVLVLDSSPTIQRCVLQECGFDSNGGGVGPAVFVHDGSPRMVECEVRFSQAGFEGNGAGAVYGESVVLEECVFLGNITAVYLGGASVVSECRFEANSGKNGGGAIFFGETLVTDCLFLQNSAFSLLGSAPAQGGGALASGDDVRFERCTFDQNFSEGLGAGLAIRGGVSVIDCTFTRNYAGPDFFGVETYGGAGLYVEGENFVSGCLFTHNRAEGPGAALRCNSPQLELEACTFAGNSSTGENGSGGALACFGGGQIGASRILIWNNCAEQGHDAAWLESGTTLSLACSDIRQTEIGGGGSVVTDAFTFEADPQFCDAGSCASSPDAEGDYSITHDSPCTAELSPCGERVGSLDPACWVTDAPLHESIETPEVRLLENPARGRVTLQLSLPGPTDVALTIHDPTGRRLHTARLSGGAGLHTISWDPPASGLYLYRCAIGGRIFTGKITRH